MVQGIPAGRPPRTSMCAVDKKGKLRKNGPSCQQGPLGALGDCEQPPKQHQNPVCHPVTFARRLVLAINSRTSRKLVNAMLWRLGSEPPKGLQVMLCCFSNGKSTKHYSNRNTANCNTGRQTR
jgi:hypothetical protein